MATASDNPKISVRKMEGDLSCCICCNLLREPKDLDCQHVYCLECLRSWVGKQPTIECPECRHITIVPVGGLENLKTDLRLKSLVETFAGQIGKQRDVPTCPDHDGERQHFYCLTCQMAVCHNCLVLKHPRPEHYIEELKDMARSKRNEMKVKMDDLREQTKKFKASEIQLEQEEMKLIAATAKAKEDLKKHITDIKADVDAKGHGMMQIIETTHDQQMHLLRQKLNHTRDNTKLLQCAQSTAQNVLGTAADHMYMKQHVTVIDRMNKLSLMENEAPSWNFGFLSFIPASIPNDSNWLGHAFLHGSKICELKLLHEFGQFGCAQGIAVNQDGWVVVVDYDAKEAVVFQASQGTYICMCKLDINSTFVSRMPAWPGLYQPYNYGISPPGIMTSPNQPSFAPQPTYTPNAVCAATKNKFFINSFNENGIAMIFSSSGTNCKALQVFLPTGFRSSARSSGPIAASPDGTIITGDSNHQVITVMKCNDERCVIMKTHNINQNRISDIASNGTQIVYTTGEDGKVCAIDFTTGQALWAMDMVFPLGICYEPNSNTLLIAGGSKYQGQFVIEQHCSTTGRLISRLVTGLCQPLAMSVTCDNKLLVADRKTVKVYEIK